MRGSTLIETLISCFLLVSTALVVVSMLGSAMRGHLHAERITTATRLGEKTIARLQEWTRDPVNFHAGPAAFSAFSGNDPDQPAFHVEVAVSPTPLRTFSPCQSLEAPFVPLGTAREMNHSVLRLQVEVSWSPASGDRIVLWTDLREPPRALSLAPTLTSEGRLVIPPGPAPHPLQITRVSGPADPVPADQTLGFEARLVDASGAPIQDVMFDWYIQPVTGNATLLDGSRTGWTRSVQNRYNFNPFTSTWGHAPGTIRVRARARYEGIEILQETPDIELAP